MQFARACRMTVVLLVAVWAIEAPVAESGKLSKMLKKGASLALIGAGGYGLAAHRHHQPSQKNVYHINEHHHHHHISSYKNTGWESYGDGYW